jgi:copper transport protein
LVAALLAGAALVMYGIPAEGHSLVRDSDPADGATVAHPPDAITIVFTEPPDPKLSQVEILDTDARKLAGGPVSPVPGSWLTVRFALPPLANGVYTVVWRTVSATDGHAATGVFAFAIGAATAGQPVPSVPSPPAPALSPLGVAGHWGLDAGYGLLLGGAWVALLAFEQISTGLFLLVAVGDALSLFGLAMTAEAGRENAAISWSAFAGTSVASGIGLVLLPVAATALVLIGAYIIGRRARRPALIVTACLAALAMLGSALASHAASSRLPWLMVPAQWVHVASFAVWIGGLAAVLVGIRGVPTPGKARAVGRFSLVAGYAFAALAITGVLRGIEDLDSWQSLVTTTFGWLLLAKSAFFVVITPLAATNRWRYVRMGIEGIPRLRWVSRGEVVLAGVIMIAAAFLTTLPPPSFLHQVKTRPIHEIVAQGVDDRGEVRVRLEVAPGYAGRNLFAATVTDRKTSRPVGHARLFLFFDLPARPEIGEEVLELRNLGGGLYSVNSTDLSLTGNWTVTVAVETSTNSFDVPLTIRALPAPTA